MVEDIVRPERQIQLRLPVFLSRISAGFPSPADDYAEEKLDLNEYLIQNPSSTFYVRAVGDSMEGAGIFAGDLVVIDRSQTAVHNSIVMAALNGEFTIKRLLKLKDKIILAPANSQYKPMQIQEGMDFQIWGVATNVIHSLNKMRAQFPSFRGKSSESFKE